MLRTEKKAGKSVKEILVASMLLKNERHDYSAQMNKDLDKMCYCKNSEYQELIKINSKFWKLSKGF